MHTLSRPTAARPLGPLGPLRPLRLAAATLVVAVAAGLSLAADAAPPGPGMPGAGPMTMMLGGPHLDRALEQAGASAEQRSQIQAILKAAREDLKAQFEAGRGLHEQLQQAFTQPTVDARTVEALRQQMLARHDQASQRQMQALLDASRVLTVEQRKALAEQMNQRRVMMQRHHADREALDAKPAAR